MSAYNFQKRFAPAIEDGTKTSTIRARRKNGYVPKAGERIKLYIGQRTRNCRLLREVTVARVTPIIVDEDSIVLNGVPLSVMHCLRISKNDGFPTWAEFVDFFKEQRGLPFNGYLIEWSI